MNKYILLSAVCLSSIMSMASSTADAAKRSSTTSVMITTTAQPLDMGQHSPLPTAMMNNGFSPSQLGTYYGNGYRVCVLNYRRSVAGKAHATFAIGNTSDKPLTITGNNIYFYMDGTWGPNDGTPNPNSTLIGGTVIIPPKHVTNIQLVGNPQAQDIQIWFNRNDSSSIIHYWFPLPANDVKDAKPETIQSSIDENPLHVPDAPDMYALAGGGKFKFEVTKILMTKNNHLGTLNRPKNGTLALVQIRLANTTNRTMNVSNLDIMSWDMKTISSVNEKPSDTTVLGKYSFPSTVASHQVITAYVPVIYEDGNKEMSVEIRSNLGSFTISRIHIFSPWD